jgi:DNA-binding NarL/FixJ family response regulator
MAFDPVAAFAGASSVQELPAIASAAAKSLIGVTGFSCAVAEGADLFLAPSYGWFEAVSFESFSELLRRAGLHVREAMRTVIAALKKSKCLDVMGHFGEEEIHQSAIGESLLRPCDIERVLLGFPRHDGKLVAIVAVYRSLRNRRFSARDRMQLERICDLFAQRAVAVTAPSGHHSLATLLDALEDHIPHAFAGLLDRDGRIIWLSERSALRLGLVAQRHGTQRILVPHSNELEAIRALARAACQQPALRRRGQRAAVDLLWPRERLLVRRVDPGDGQPAVLLFVPRSIDRPEMVDTSERTRTGGLSRREAEVAELAIRGYSVANIAARLALKDQTIKTFLRRIYSKLQVRNRAELCYEVLCPRSEIRRS